LSYLISGFLGIRYGLSSSRSNGPVHRNTPHVDSAVLLFQRVLGAENLRPDVGERVLCDSHMGFITPEPISYLP